MAFEFKTADVDVFVTQHHLDHRMDQIWVSVLSRYPEIKKLTFVGVRLIASGIDVNHEPYRREATAGDVNGTFDYSERFLLGPLHGNAVIMPSKDVPNTFQFLYSSRYNSEELFFEVTM